MSTIKGQGPLSGRAGGNLLLTGMIEAACDIVRGTRHTTLRDDQAMNPYILQAILINVGLGVVALVLLYVVIRLAVAHAIRSSELSARVRSIPSAPRTFGRGRVKWCV